VTQLEVLQSEVIGCTRCPRLVAWRQLVAREKRAAYADETYWGRPVPGFGDPAARLVVVGLAPAAHGANRTGRMFTGDRSGDWLYRALHRAGFASQPTSVGVGDGLRLIDAWVTAPVRCAPPDNKPSTAERDNCLPWLEAELSLLDRTRVVVCLGGFAWGVVHRLLGAGGTSVLRPRPRFGHSVESITGGPLLIASYHPSQQNTVTGRLTEEMLDAVFSRVREEINIG